MAKRKEATMDTSDNLEQTQAADVAVEAAAPKAPRVSKHAEIAKEVRRLRAIPRDDDPTKPKYTHDQVGEQLGIKGSLVSQIARNIVAHDPDYTPVFDGHRNLGPRKEFQARKAAELEERQRIQAEAREREAAAAPQLEVDAAQE